MNAFRGGSKEASGGLGDGVERYDTQRNDRVNESFHVTVTGFLGEDGLEEGEGTGLFIGDEEGETSDGGEGSNDTKREFGVSEARGRGRGRVDRGRSREVVVLRERHGV